MDNYFSSLEKTGWTSGVPHEGSSPTSETHLIYFPIDRYRTEHLTQLGYSSLKPNPSTLATAYGKVDKQFRALLQMCAMHLDMEGLQLNCLYNPTLGKSV